MVARLPLTLRIEPMTVADIEQVHDIERASFPVPWPSYAFRQELESNRMAHYLVVPRRARAGRLRRRVADGRRGARDLVRGACPSGAGTASAVA